MTKEEIIKIHIPNGIQNIKGRGDGKPQYRAEIEAIEKCMEQYANQRAIEIAGEAFDAGYKRGWGQSEFEGESVTPNKETFLSQLKTKLSQP